MVEEVSGIVRGELSSMYYLDSTCPFGAVTILELYLALAFQSFGGVGPGLALYHGWRP